MTPLPAREGDGKPLKDRCIRVQATAAPKTGSREKKRRKGRAGPGRKLTGTVNNAILDSGW